MGGNGKEAVVTAIATLCFFTTFGWSDGYFCQVKRK